MPENLLRNLVIYWSFSEHCKTFLFIMHSASHPLFITCIFEQHVSFEPICTVLQRSCCHVPGPLSTWTGDCLWTSKPSWYITYQPGELSLSSLRRSWVGKWSRLYLPVWLELRRDALTCVGWQVIPHDPRCMMKTVFSMAEHGHCCANCEQEEEARVQAEMELRRRERGERRRQEELLLLAQQQTVQQKDTTQPVTRRLASAVLPLSLSLSHCRSGGRVTAPIRFR